ncbi:hypothetical protein AKG98_2369 [Moritella sp. JT01]|uniref:hypothetical protein n=1 Tax=Moritella sp. JT01 TaxID=756698 RepID=UPI0007952868|nr:hypothetical protein [Moritella sp. JT01]KXO13796.1 hypothetical protein AKG98_2369 [Moritella sp. JT01]
MNKIVLMILLCVSLQGCSSFGYTPEPEDKAEPAAKPKKQGKNGLLAITQFMTVMTLLKTQVD